VVSKKFGNEKENETSHGIISFSLTNEINKIHVPLPFNDLIRNLSFSGDVKKFFGNSP
jgi:hypothetical protein